MSSLRLILPFATALLLASHLQAQTPANSQLDSIITRANAAGTFDGVVLVARGDRVIYRSAVGLADRSWNIPHGIDTRLPWASVSKQVTAVLVLQLVHEGRLTLSTPLRNILPGLRAEHAGRVTIRQLLQNTSGLPADLVTDFSLLSDSAFDAAFHRALAADLSFEPGSRFQYSNTDYHALGRVTEVITGQSYEEALRQRILSPSGMNETALVRHDAVEPRMPTGYLTSDSAGARPVPYTRIARFGAAGGLAGPIDDLFRFNRALLTDRLIPRSLRAEMFTGDPALGYVALSVRPYPRKVGDRTVMLVERQGFIEGYRALNLLVPAEDLMLVVLANNSRADLSVTYASDGFSYSLLSAALSSMSKLP